ncbi:MAG: double-strand break repair helicase AddA [Nitratireductor sp.]
MAELRKIPPETRQAQARASDPRHSAWVSANAGSGKTFVLARRVIRLLLDGVAPGKILCLTYTKAAAAEMANRIFETLGQWAAIEGGELETQLADVLGYQPDQRQLRRARTLFALSLDTPGGLKIQTIHAFCEALLHQFPLEANVSGHFEVMEEMAQQALVEEARHFVLVRMQQPDQTGSPLNEAFAHLLAVASDHQIETAIGRILTDREAFLTWVDGDVVRAMAEIRKKAGFAPEATPQSIIADGLARSAITMPELAVLAEAAAATGGPTNVRFANIVAELANTEDPQSALALRNRLFLTQKLEPRDAFVTKPVAKNFDSLMEKCKQEAEWLQRLNVRVANLAMIEASQSLFIVANAILERYESIKRNRGLVDFGELIAAAANLLARSDVREWVQYKLDRGIDHVLVDEAQDTSPRQWEIINAIIEDFHSGKGAGHAVRTVFAVGDEKQSIYSFQGADPGGFSRQRERISKRALAANYRFESVPLNLSFRSTPDVLAAVDAVFAISENAQGLSASGEITVHSAIREKDAGEVRIWPLFASEAKNKVTDWLAPIDAPAPGDPALQLAGRIAMTIEEWISKEEELPGRNKPLQYGDILILVRKRDRFVPAIIRELKRRGLAIAGADRLHLTDHTAVEDLMALGRVMCLPEDDLALAALLKSPVFGFDDDELIEVAAEREGKPLIRRLHEFCAQDHGPPLQDKIAMALKQITRLRSVAQQNSVHRFYAHALGPAGCRAALLSRFGTEAEDVIDAFEQAALAHETASDGGLETFLASLSRNPPQIKREVDMKKNEIRVMTVHSAKGLEAPVVFVVDPCSPGFVRQHAPEVIALSKDDINAGYLWKHGKHADALDERLEEIAEDAEAEYRRLLYVAMTRAADRLIMCGYRGARQPPEHHWHSMVKNALAQNAEEVRDEEGNLSELIWRRPLAPGDGRVVPPGPPDDRENTDTRHVDDLATGDPAMGDDVVFPGMVEAETPLPKPLNPSLAGLALGRRADDSADGSAVGESSAAGVAQVDPTVRRQALERGNAIHKLLQYLPDLPVEERQGACETWLSLNLPGWPSHSLDQITAQVLAILEAPQNRKLFAPGSRAEAGLAGMVRIGGKDIAVSGQVDRISVLDDIVMVCDYKTNRIVPETDADIDPAYLLQLALYRALLQQIFPSKRIVCRLIWVENGSVSEPDDSLLDRSLNTVYPDEHTQT